MKLKRIGPLIPLRSRAQYGDVPYCYPRRTEVWRRIKEFSNLQLPICVSSSLIFGAMVNFVNPKMARITTAA